jgi:hypothetical protein
VTNPFGAPASADVPKAPDGMRQPQLNFAPALPVHVNPSWLHSQDLATSSPASASAGPSLSGSDMPAVRLYVPPAVSGGNQSLAYGETHDHLDSSEFQALREHRPTAQAGMVAQFC